MCLVTFLPGELLLELSCRDLSLWSDVLRPMLRDPDDLGQQVLMSLRHPGAPK